MLMNNNYFFPEFSCIDKSRLQKRLFKEENKESDNIVDSETEKLTSVLFAVDPVTGHPKSDIATMMSKDTNPEVARYIRDNLMTARETSGTSDVDEALATVKTPAMSKEDYEYNLVNFIDKKQHSKSKK